MAVIGRHADVAKLLSDRGAGLNIQDKNGTTALIFSVAVGDKTIARALVAKGPDQSIKDNSGHTALDWAQQKHDESLTAVLSTAAHTENQDLDSVRKMIQTASESRQIMSECLRNMKDPLAGYDGAAVQKRMDDVPSALRGLPPVIRRMGIPLRNGVLFAASGVRIMQRDG